MTSKQLRDIKKGFDRAYSPVIPFAAWVESTGFDSLTLAVSLGQAAFDSRAVREGGGNHPGDGGMAAGEDRPNHKTDLADS